MSPVNRSKEDVVQEYRVQSIQDATLRVVGRRGIAAATIQEIADEAGVAKGTIYLYFRDRDELLERTFEEAMERLMAGLDQALDEDSPLEDKLRRSTAAHLRFFAENREFFRLYLSLRMPEGTQARQRCHARSCASHYKTRVEKLAKLLAQGMETGEVRRADPYRLALFVIEGSTAIILERLSEETTAPEDEDVELIVGVILDGIRGRR